MAEAPLPAAPRRRGSRPLVLLAVAVVAIGGAGWSIWISAGDDIVRSIADLRQALKPPAAPPAPRPVAAAAALADSDPACWTEVAIFRAGPTRPRPVVVVRRARQSEPNQSSDGVTRGTLARELVRQGFILAAREGFDVVARDVDLGDADELGTADATYRLGSLFQAKKYANPGRPEGGRLAVVTGTGERREVLWHATLDCMAFEYPDYARLVDQLRRVVDKDFRDLLAGWKLPPRASRAPARPDALPDGVGPQLASLAEVDQFAALRAIHAMIRAEGGSPARWRALARGYALLGSLTETLVGPEHAISKARALLYAEGAADATKDSPAALRDRAFVAGLAGIDAAARADLDRADEADGGRGKSPRDAVLRAHLAADPDALGKLAAFDPADPLPVYLKGIVRSRISGRSGSADRKCRNEIVAALDEVLDRVPDCHRVVAEMCFASGVNNSHRATTIDLGTFAATSARRLRALPDLPAAVATSLTAVDGEGDEFAIRQVLRKAAADDASELSWGALARHLADIRFLQVAQRLNFLAYLLNAGAPDFAEAARPLVADHPLRELLDLHAGTLDLAGMIALAERFDYGDAEIKDYDIFQPINNLYRGRPCAAWMNAMVHGDWGLATNLERIARHQEDPAGRANWCRALLSDDPESPVARALLVEADWDRRADQVAKWEAEQPWNTALIAGHGLQLVKLGRPAEAEAPLEAALKRSPEGWLFRGLAEAFRDQGKIDRWVAGAEAMMQQPTQGLDQAVVANDLALYFMDQGDAERAWPWAQRAARSGAGWALMTAMRCAEMRDDGKDAEARVARLSQRYEQNWLDWLTWCVRTGEGHRDEAAKLVWERWEANRRVASPNEGVLLADLALILDKADVARQVAEARLAAETNSTVDAFHLALAADRLGDAAARDAAFDRIVGETNPSAPRTAKILGLLIDARRRQVAPDLAKVDAVLDEIPDDRRPPTDTLVGLFLDRFGPADHAVDYLKRGDVKINFLGLRLIARHALQARGEPLADIATTRPTTTKPDAAVASP